MAWSRSWRSVRFGRVHRAQDSGLCRPGGLGRKSWERSYHIIL